MLKNIYENKGRKLNFGCGEKIIQGWDNCDIQKESPINFDFNKFPYPLKSNYYHYILINQVLEHLKQPYKVLRELHNKCRSQAIIKIIVPHYNNKGAYDHMEHEHYFTEQCFKELEQERNVISKERLFKINKIILKPTKVGQRLPKSLREKLALFMGGIISQIIVEIKVIK